MGRASSKGRLLIVDDDYSVCTMLAEKFSSEGYECDSCSEAGLALDLMQRQAYDAVILDLMMPETTGLEVLIIAKKKYPQTAFLILSGMYDPQLAAQAIKQGADDFLVKPIQLNELVGRVACAIEKKLCNNDRDEKPPES